MRCETRKGEMPDFPEGCDVVRILWSDLHGAARGKDIAAADFPRLAGEGIHFCQALMLTDLGANPLEGPETSGSGFPDGLARPDLSTLMPLAYAPDLACCLADLYGAANGRPLASSPRGLLKRQIARLGPAGIRPIVGPEMEFYLCAPEPFSSDRHAQGPAGHRWVAYPERDSAGYLVGALGEPDGLLTSLLRSGANLGAFAASHEFSGGQFEINQHHGPALAAADRAFLLRHVVKEIAALRRMRATFMGKPFNNKAGSGFHLHLSLEDAQGRNLFADAAAKDGLSRRAHAFLAGILRHAQGLSAILNPTVNAYKRLAGGALAPQRANWGYDNRTALIRIPPDRGASARLEIRGGDRAANPYLLIAALLAAGVEGMARRLNSPEPITGSAASGPLLPRSLATALAALEADPVLSAALGRGFVSAFTALKRQEIARFERHVTDWEFTEYSWLL